MVFTFVLFVIYDSADTEFAEMCNALMSGHTPV